MTAGGFHNGSGGMESARHCRELVERWLADGSFDARLPEVARLRGVLQPEQYHAEGDAWTHTMLAMDAVPDDADPRVFWGVLLHDIGKAETTAFIKGRWRSWGHAEAGAGEVSAIMTRLGFPHLAGDVTWLVKHHTFHFSWNLTPGARLSPKQRRFMEHPLFPLLLEVCDADAAGSRGGSDKGVKIGQLADMYADVTKGWADS
ncbi:HD domain-containing protein [Geobacter grbiciae]|uniref:HD domain-containing protein n=1 Tax=Geobacter grbiciae TaxID=155042 RepID=UPI001C02FCFB|nr:HD domain-containing protein [Geobacter grbiciae]MBT1076123.1 HD domain-containing protein [Geobacter grbiciae]